MGAIISCPRLGVNIDHVATIRNARGGRHPDPVRAAHQAVEAGADGITAHLREDRRHISDLDIARLKSEVTRPLNLEMAPTSEMLEIARRHVPNACCLVPERREERTTEGGLDVISGGRALQPIVSSLQDVGIRVSLFVEPDANAIDAAVDLQADIVELHTGSYCEAALIDDAEGFAREFRRIELSTKRAHDAGLEVHAGHGLTYTTVGRIAALSEVVELNIGHFLIGEALFVGLNAAISRMRIVIEEARQQAQSKSSSKVRRRREAS